MQTELREHSCPRKIPFVMNYVNNYTPEFYVFCIFVAQTTLKRLLQKFHFTVLKKALNLIESICHQTTQKIFQKTFIKILLLFCFPRNLVY